MDIARIPIGRNPPHDVNVIVEVPAGGEPVKYEMDKASGALFVDRFLHTAMSYPGNYGFVPHTLSMDGDPIDVLIVGETRLVPARWWRVRPIGALVMEDEGGGDEKILAVPVDALHPIYEGVRNHTDLPPLITRQIEHFFQHYKTWKRASGSGWGTGSTPRVRRNDRGGDCAGGEVGGAQCMANGRASRLVQILLM